MKQLLNGMLMKKVIALLVLCMSTTLAMAQFGDLDDILNKAGKPQNESAHSDNHIGKTNVEKAFAQGLVAIRQDFQLEDTVTGELYNFGDNKDRFGGQISFMVKLGDGIVIPDAIIRPWDDDPNYPEYKNKQYVPYINRTSLLKVSQSNWKELEIPLWPNIEGELANGLKYVIDEESKGAITEATTSSGFRRSSGYGEKEVWVVWLSLSEMQCEFMTQQIELTLEADKKIYKMEAPASRLSLLGGIVVEPIYTGIGRVDFALVGIIGKSDGQYNMAVIEPNMAEEILISEKNNSK